MPTNITGRVVLILAVVFVALWSIFPRGDLSKPALKPGIDMVGGTSLLYEIKVPPGASPSDNLADEVAGALKKRVDPNGVRNLIWRPQGNTRLEIQMPMTGRSIESEKIREEFGQAQRALEATNVRTSEVLYVVQELKGEERAQKLKALEQGSTTRATILGAMTSIWDQIQQAQQARNAAEQARLELDYRNLIEKLEATNLEPLELEAALERQTPEAQQKALAEIKQRYPDFPQRQQAIEQYAAQYPRFREVRETLDDSGELKRLLQGSGVIEFHILANDLPAQQYQEMVDRLQRRGPSIQAGDTVRWYEVDRSAEVMQQMDRVVQDLLATTNPTERTAIIRRVTQQGGSGVAELMDNLVRNLNDPQRREEIQNEIENALLIGHPLVEYNGRKWALAYITPDKSLTRREGQPWALERAYPSMESGTRQVGFQFDAQGARLFGNLTTNNVNRPLAIVLDEKMISAPNINTPITGGSGVITGGGRGGFAEPELRYLVSTLSAGALPAQLNDEPISERHIGPQIGADNLRRGLLACVFGLCVVAVFLIGYYYLSGVVAMIAVLLNMVLILGAMAAIGATFTLPGIAGIVLTIGMAVDANVLIFERLREEQVRGLSIQMALRNAYDRAWYAIVDGNVTTAITAIFLYMFGSEEVSGFGLTLLFGIVSSMFTALYVTRTIFAILVKRFDIRQLSSLPLTFPKWDRTLRPNVDWMNKAWIFYSFSVGFIVIGLALFAVKWKQGKMLDIEFASGTAVEFELKEPMDIEDLRKVLNDASKANPQALPAPAVVSVGTDEKTYEVVTPNVDVAAVRAAVLQALPGKLNIREEARFDMVDRSFGEASGQVVLPIEAGTTTIAGQSPDALRTHIGGVAIVLKNLNPPLDAEEISRRIEQQRLQPQVSTQSAAARTAKFDVETNADKTQAIIMASDPNLMYEAGDAIRLQAWDERLAAPMWNLVREAVAKPPTLQKVTNFDAQIAGETQQQALIALVLSILAVMLYIWLRFGNFKYGTATAIALLHDTLFTLAAVGFAHYIADTAIGTALLIEPFRVNLNLVAAILTVIGYSMNDTVVVFDRIRENRGKLGHVDRNVVNDSINQTLSRTLLTGGTTLVTIFVMYVSGGSGIHGFTFALLVGILVGTYSSIAIAAPILLIGESQTQTSRGKTVGQRQQLQGA